MHRKVIVFLILISFMISCRKQVQEDNAVSAKDSIRAAWSKDPLPGWNEGKLKDDIIAYIKKVTKKGSSDFIPIEDRIATFDNDGTLLAEKPLIQELFAIYQIKKRVAENPELAQKQPFKAIIENDKSFFIKGGEKAALELVGVTHTGMTEEEFELSAKDFFAVAKFPGKNVPIKKMRYQPQLELLDYLRANSFKTYIVSGGTVEFIRSISEDFYGIPKDQVVGSSFKYKFDEDKNAIQREPVLDHFNDKEGKPVAIQLHIGRRPVFACGNEGGAGDIAMLKYSQGNKYPSFQLLINHDDAIREFSYQEKDKLSLNTASKNKWHVVSIRDDWKKVFAD